jgi:hypothetical protein
MVMLTDLLERKEQLEQENARIERKLSILRQIDELAKQLEDPELPVEPAIPEPPAYEGDVAGRTNGASPAAAPEPEPEPEPELEPELEPEPEPEPEAEPAETEAAAEPQRRKSSESQRERILQALVDLRGTALQIDLLKKSGLASPLVSAACRDLAEAGLIRAIGRGGYQNRSVKWQLTADKLPPAVAQRPISPRVRKVIEQEAKRSARQGRQPATHEGRILTRLVMHDTMTVPELAADLGIPASTVGRLIGKLREEGEVVDKTGNGDWRRVMVG